MPRFRYSLRTLLIVAPVVAIAAMGLTWYVNESIVFDVTKKGPSTCEVHGVPMTKKLVGLTFGMRMLTPTDDARRRIFPHADEVYDTGFCMPIQEKWARVYVCASCSKARTTWLDGNTTP